MGERKYAQGSYGQKPFNPGSTMDPISKNIIPNTPRVQVYDGAGQANASSSGMLASKSIVDRVSPMQKQLDKPFEISSLLKNDKGNYTMNSVLGPAKTAFDAWATWEGIQTSKDYMKEMTESREFQEMDRNRQFALLSDQYWKDNNRRMGSRADYDKRHNGGAGFTGSEYDQHMANRNSGVATEGFYNGINDSKGYIPASSSALAGSPQIAPVHGRPMNGQSEALAMADTRANAVQPTHADRQGRIVKKKRKKKKAPSESPESGTSKDSAELV